MKRKTLVLTVLALLVAGAGAVPWQTPAQVAPQVAPQRVEIIAKRFEFEPAEITLKKGEPVVLVLKSEDVAHGLSIRELNVNVKLKNHGTSEAQFTPDVAGDFVAHCSVFCGVGHGSMMLKVHVTE
jgi:cytochrome c oxidase subunit II